LNTIQQFRRSGLNALFALDETLCLADGEWFVYDSIDGWLRYSPIFCPDLQENPPSLASIRMINRILCTKIAEDAMLLSASRRAAAARQPRSSQGHFISRTQFWDEVWSVSGSGYKPELC
jgi:hypothetical protein